MDAPMPQTLGVLADGRRSEPLAIARLLLVWHLCEGLT